MAMIPGRGNMSIPPGRNTLSGTVYGLVFLDRGCDKDYGRLCGSTEWCLVGDCGGVWGTASGCRKKSQYDGNVFVKFFENWYWVN